MFRPDDPIKHRKLIDMRCLFPALPADLFEVSLVVEDLPEVICFEGHRLGLHINLLRTVSVKVVTSWSRRCVVVEDLETNHVRVGWNGLTFELLSYV